MFGAYDLIYKHYITYVVTANYHRRDFNLVYFGYFSKFSKCFCSAVDQT